MWGCRCRRSWLAVLATRKSIASTSLREMELALRCGAFTKTASDSRGYSQSELAAEFSAAQLSVAHASVTVP